MYAPKLLIPFFLIAGFSLAAPPPDLGTRILWSVPLFPQSTNYSCGAAALRSALAYYGVILSEADIMKAAGTTPQDGTEMEPMAALAQAKGIGATVRTDMTVAELREIAERGQLSIPTLQAYPDSTPGKPNPPWGDDWDDGHYMVVIGADAHEVYFEDPSQDGSRGYIPIAEFNDRWHDLSIKLGKMQHPAIVLEGTPKPAVWQYVP
jgi:predicted double-glycine peptidase